MKNNQLLLLSFLLLSIAANTQKFVLNGKISGQKEGYVYLLYTNKDEKNIKDSSVIKNGSFRITGSINEPTMCFFHGDLKSNDVDDPNSTDFFLEPTTMSITVKKDDFKNAIVKGSKTQDENAALQKQYKPVQNEMKALADAYSRANNNLIDAERNKASQAVLDSLNEKVSELHNQFDAYSVRFSKIDDDFFRSNPSSYVSAYKMRFYITGYPLDTLQMFYNNMNETVKNSRYGKNFFKEIQKLRSGSPGSIAKDFTTKDIKENLLSLSQFKGKYVLLDFWASWCVPCRKSNPHLKELYALYKEKGFEIIGISDDDNNSTAWKAAVEKDGLPWQHVLRGMDMDKIMKGEENPGDISEKYGVHSLPTKILIDTNGVIIGRYGEGRDDEDVMDKKLAQVLNK